MVTLPGRKHTNMGQIACARTPATRREQQDRLARTTEALVLDGQEKPDSLDSYEGRFATFSLVRVPAAHSLCGSAYRHVRAARRATACRDCVCKCGFAREGGGGVTGAEQL